MDDSGAEPEGTHHYVMTLQAPVANGYTVVSSSGAYTPPVGGETRYRSYMAILRHVYSQNTGLPPGASVLFFSLEPNFVARPTEQ